MTHEEVRALVPAIGGRVAVDIVKGPGDDGRQFVGGHVEGVYEGDGVGEVFAACGTEPAPGITIRGDDDTLYAIHTAGIKAVRAL